MDATGQGFHAQWQPTDTTHLAPTNLPLARVRRAWERKAISPLSRVGRSKIWKRAAVRPVIATTTTIDLADQVVGGGGDDVLVGVNGKRGRGAGSPLKSVKKVKLDCGGGVGSGVVVKVSRWEEPGSPGRRIVTRSSAGLADIVALAEEGEEGEQVEEEEEEEGDVTVEVFDQDGQLVEGAEGAEEDEQSWSDVEVELEKDEEGAFEHPMTHLPHAMSHNVDTSTWASSEGNEMVEKAAEDEEEIAANTTISLPVKSAPILSAPSEVILPEGFVSPAKQRRKLGPRSSRTVSAARRQTLPVQFAPAVIATARQNSAPVEVEAVQMEEPREEVGKLGAEELDLHMEEQEGAAQAHDGATNIEMVQEAEVDDVVPIGDNEVEAAATNDEWEDIGEEDDEEQQSEGQDVPSEEEEVSHTQSDMLAPQEDKLQSSPAASTEGPHPRPPLRRSPRRKSSSPLKQSTVFDHTEKPHLVAFTPLKRVQDMPYNDHFTNPPEQESETHSQETPPTDLLPRAISAPPEEEPLQISPRKASSNKPPRISDDTALLQAFLHRAAAEKNKTSRRRLSASEKESLTNRRDSDTVRQALASPGTGKGMDTVLGELDVNTFLSPRKAEKGLEGLEGGGMDWEGGKEGVKGDQVTDDLARSEDVLKETDGDDTPADPTPASAGPDPVPEEELATRRTRSGRERKKPQVYSQPQSQPQQPQHPTFLAATSVDSASGPVPAALVPSRITIRGTASATDFHVKRSEAQELAVVTRSNTRKNKGGSTMPRGRIGGLNKEWLVEDEREAEGGGGGEGEDGGGVDAGVDAEVRDAVVGVDERKKKKRKTLTWSETLVSFYQGGTADPETSQLSDEPEEKMPWERGADFDPTVEILEVEEPSKKKVKVAKKAVPAVETPSKPKAQKPGKMRKLQKGGRTASSSATAPAPAAAAPEKDMVAIRHTDVEMAIPAAAAAEQKEEEEGEEEEGARKDEKAKPVSKARRSRIATPAKGRGMANSASNSALLPSDLNLAPTTISVSGTTTTTMEKKGPLLATAAASKKRGAVSASRLPAPGSISAPPAQPAPAPALGLISSPAKKPRSTTSAPSTVAGAPKLDFSAAETFKPTFTFTTAENDTAAAAATVPVLGLMSPAKKPRGRPMGSGLGTEAGAHGKLLGAVGEERDAGAGSGVGLGVALGLGASPAKRSRRRVG
ncbi:hypothetical protein LTR78_004098 [Recurvomyces mirabilis]|uniref:Uncharacterized protein n=1 Tax=Recurvomyces mirabilis TaxID=574656 RepID=A0AAE0WQB5_9PEZI|nr:hypothetical protein LTR78_004098 [Recurvomyces mirabilis]